MLKLGRTQLQDAVPMTLGQEFGAFAVTIGEDADRLGEARAADRRDQPRRHGDRHRASMRTPAMRHSCCDDLRDITGLPLPRPRT